MPSSLLKRGVFLCRLHSSHQGQQSTFLRARDVVYWPGMLEDIKRVTTTCPRTCQHKPNKISEHMRFQNSHGLSQSNGKAESAVQIAKRLLKMCPDPYLALLEWRNTPTSGMGSSPNQRLFSTRTWGVLVTSQERLKPEIQEDMGMCMDQLSDRSYIVDVDGQILRRNRVFLRPSSHQPDVDAEDRMSDQGPTKELPVPNVENPALEVTTLPRAATTVEGRSVHLAHEWDQL
ncbi:hypothetical protein EMCRGX_G015342 [Ephydatia muelleri]